MTTINASSQSAWNAIYTKQNCYNETIDQFDKTVFESPGQGVVVTYTDFTDATGSNVQISESGMVSLTGNVTYKIDHYCELVPNESYSQTAGQDTAKYAGHVLVNAATGSVIYPPVAMGTTGSVIFTPAEDLQIFQLAFMPDGPAGDQNNPITWQYPQQITNSSICVVAIAGEDF